MPDNLTPQQRSYCMSRIKGKDTGLEVRVRSALHRRGFRFRKHLKSLPGKPDVVFTKARVAVFVDGDFWHGYEFQTWQHKVSEFWKTKISKTRERDAKTDQRLRGMGWTVVRIWEHDLKQDFEGSVGEIVSLLRSSDTEYNDF